MPAGSETLQEIKFWVELEGVLQNITDQLETPESRTFTHTPNLRSPRAQPRLTRHPS